MEQYKQFVNEAMEIKLKTYHHPKLVEQKIIPMLNLVAFIKGPKKAKTLYQRMVNEVPNNEKSTPKQTDRPTDIQQNCGEH